MKTNLKRIVGAILLSGSVALMADGDRQTQKCGGKEKMGDKRFKMMDKNSDGLIEKSEFKGPPHIFDKIDADGDGKISKEEMKQRHEAMIKEFDTDGDGELSAEEREKMQEKMAQKRLSEKFSEEDMDGDGFLDKSEFKGPPQAFDKIDENGDGKISEEELKNARPMQMMKKGGKGKGKMSGAEENDRPCKSCDNEIPKILEQ